MESINKTGTGFSVNNGDKHPAMLEAQRFTIAGGCSTIIFARHGNGVNPSRSLAVRAEPVTILPRVGEFSPTISVTHAKRLARRTPRTPRSNRRPAAPKRQLDPVGTLSYEPLPAGPVAQRQYRHIRPDNEGQPAVAGTEYHNVLGSNYSLSGHDRRPAPGIIFQYPNPALPAVKSSAIGPMIQDGEPESSSANTVQKNQPASCSPGKEPVEGSSVRPLDVEIMNPMNRVNLRSGEGTSNMKLLETMWFARAVGDDGRVVKGFVFNNSPGDEVRIACTCHGHFHSPEEFLGHAGASDVSDPFKSIIVSSFQI